MRYLVAIGMMAMVGCSGAEVSEVTGQVLVGGMPADPGTTVIFWPEVDLSLGCISVGRLEEDGAFTVKPREERGEGKAGAYVVIVALNAGESVGNSMASGESVLGVLKQLSTKAYPLPIYKDAKTTPLRAELRPGVNHLDPIEVEGLVMEGKVWKTRK